MRPDDSARAYTKDLLKRVDAAFTAIKKAETPKEVSEQERMAHPLLKELQMATPRICDELMRAARDRRLEIRDQA